MPRTPFQTFQYGMAIVRNPLTQKWLVVQEKNELFWVPAGGVDPGELPSDATIRECKEEAGVTITLKGLLRVEYSLTRSDRARMRVIYYAEPADPLNCTPKSFRDSESNAAFWMSLEEIRAQDVKGCIRGEEILRWPAYIEAGGTIFPLDVMQAESQGPKMEDISTNTSPTSTVPMISLPPLPTTTTTEPTGGGETRHL